MAERYIFIYLFIYINHPLLGWLTGYGNCIPNKQHQQHVTLQRSEGLTDLSCKQPTDCTNSTEPATLAFLLEPLCPDVCLVLGTG
jgi:hypothetical protein